MKRIGRGMLCLTLVAIVLGSTASGQDLSLSLTDPANGSQVRVEPGARALHLVFLAVWCSRCIDELDPLTELEARWNGHGYRLVLIAVQTRHTSERLARFAADHRLPGEFLFDVTGNAAASLDAGELPTHLVFDETGREVLRSASYQNGVADAVGHLLAEPSAGSSP